MKTQEINFGDKAAVLRGLGQRYKNPADALKEHISNAIDEYLKAESYSAVHLPPCCVLFVLLKDEIVIEYPYGMSQYEFVTAFDNVSTSGKKNIDAKQIGEMGIGIFSYLQVGKKCVFFSKKTKDDETLKVTLKDNSKDAVYDKPIKRECLIDPGIRIVISELICDPLKPRSPLSAPRLQKFFAETFDAYLRSGKLEIKIQAGKETLQVEPEQIHLPRIGEFLKNYPLVGDYSKKFSCEFYYDPSGNGVVGIRHDGVLVVRNIRELFAYGLEQSIYAEGYIRGTIDADFLLPYPSRDRFRENTDWERLIDTLIQLASSVQNEVDALKKKTAEQKLTEIKRKALELAHKILSSDMFSDIDLLETKIKKSPEPVLPPNGFDFVPESIRVSPGDIKSIPLKAFVPNTLADGSQVRFEIDNPNIEIRPKRTILEKSHADENGVVTFQVYITCKEKTDGPAILTAHAPVRGLRAEARVRIAEKTQTRESGGENDIPRFDFIELPFEDGAKLHGRSISTQIQINTLNPDYLQEMLGNERDKLFYSTLLIGKEHIANNDKTGITGRLLEKFLTFYFELKRNVRGKK